MINEIHDELHHHLFFFWITLCDEESEGGETCLIDLHFAIFLESVFIFLEKPHKEKCPDTLVAVGKWMILDDEIQEMRRLFLDGRIEIRPTKRRNNIRKYPLKTLVFLIAKKLGCLGPLYELIAEFSDGRSRLIIADDVGDVLISHIIEATRIIAVQRDE